MKKLLLALLCVCALTGCVPTLYAQSFPATVNLIWDANPASDNVSSYTVKLDTAPGSAVDPS